MTQQKSTLLEKTNLLHLQRPLRDLGIPALISIGIALTTVTQWYLVAMAIHAIFFMNQSLDMQMPLLGWLLGSLGMRTLLTAVRKAFCGQVAVSHKCYIRNALTAQLLATGRFLKEAEHSGAQTTTFYSAIDALGPYHARFIPQAVHAAVVAVGLGLFLFTLDLKSALLLALTGPLLLIFLWLIGSATRQASNAQWQKLGLLGSSFADALAGLDVLQAFNRRKTAQAMLQQSSEDFRLATMKVLRVAFLSGFVLELAATLSTALIAVTVGVRLFEGRLDFFTALFVLLLTPEFFLPLRQLGADHHAAMEARAAAEKLAPILAQPAVQAGRVQPAAKPPTLRFLAVGLERGGKEIFREQSFTVSAGGQLHLRGASGAGKTSLFNILMGFLPYRGQIFVDQVALCDLDIQAWRAHIAVISQQPYVRHASLRENLQLANPEASDETLTDVLLRVWPQYRSSLPQGLDTDLGEVGSSLSGGEKARLAAARAILKGAFLWLLDEPTAHLDAASERALWRVLLREANGKTVLIASHLPVGLPDAMAQVTLTSTAARAAENPQDNGQEAVKEVVL